MSTRLCFPVAAGLLAIVPAVFGQGDSLRWNEFKPRLTIDFGHIVRGEHTNELTFHPLNRSTVILDQEAVYGNWELGAGFRSVVWWPFPGGNDPLRRNLRGMAQLSQLQARRDFGEGDTYLRFGFFPYKYNPDAVNLGEYLHRSGTYPGVLQNTDGYHLVDFALYEAYGAHLHLAQWDGMLTHNFTLFAEPVTIPIGDLTPAYEVSIKLPLVELGAGAAWNRLISTRPSAARPKTFENAYVRVDSAGQRVFEGPFGAAPQKTKLETGSDTSITYEAEYWTKRGIKLMARAAADFGFLLPEEVRFPGDLRIFAEVALLGLENQPYYYEEPWRRAPLMFGVNAPTFGLLDRLSVQAEYYASEFSNNFSYQDQGYPRWGRPYSQPYVSGRSSRDNWKWSVYGKKTVNRLLRVHAQAANDHLRLPEFTGNVSATELTNTPKHWYYVLRLEGGF